VEEQWKNLYTVQTTSYTQWHFNKYNKINQLQHNRQYTCLTAFFQDKMGKPVSETLNKSGFNEARDDGMAVVSPGPYAKFCTLLQKDNHASISS